MKKTAQNTSTQAFTQILDIQDNIVLFQGNAACIIIRVTSVNFALLSGEEQDAKVFAYASLLNSLSSPIQIVVRSKPVHIDPYLDSLTAAIQTTNNPQLKDYITEYKDFVSRLVKTSTVLDKEFYLVISYSSLEAGVETLVRTTTQSKSAQADFFEQAKATLQTKAETLLSQIHRLSLQAEILEKDALMKLFYDIYNQGESFSMTNLDMENPMVKGIA